VSRDTGDTLILMLTVTVCVVVIVGVLGVFTIEILGKDPDPLPSYLVGAVSTLIGMVAGYLAGSHRK
jgi:hypothetical protein